MKKLIIIATLCVLIFGHCRSKSSNENISITDRIAPKALPKEEYNTWFYSGGDFLYAIYYSLESNTSFIYESNNHARNWKKLVTFEGSITSISSFGNTIVCSLYKVDNEYSVLKISKNNGQSWSTFMIGKGIIRGVSCTSENNWLITGTIDSKKYVSKTIDSGENWTKVDVFDKFLLYEKDLIVHDNEVLGAVSGFSLKTLDFFKYNIETGDITSWNIDQNSVLHSVTKFSNYITITYSKNENYYTKRFENCSLTNPIEIKIKTSLSSFYGDPLLGGVVLSADNSSGFYNKYSLFICSNNSFKEIDIGKPKLSESFTHNNKVFIWANHEFFVLESKY